MHGPECCYLSGPSADEQEALTEHLPTINDDGVVVFDDRLVGKCSSRRTSSRHLKSSAHGAHTRWPMPSEWSAVTTGLRLGRVVRDARLPYLRNYCTTSVQLKMSSPRDGVKPITKTAN